MHGRNFIHIIELIQRNAIEELKNIGVHVKRFAGLKHSLRQFIRFGYLQAMSCIFPAAIFASLGVSKLLPISSFVPRYDFILLVSLLVQVILYFSGLETKDEIKVIMMFHVLGLGLEIFKVHMGSWSYPEAAWTKVFGVPLYSGFMYSSVASYMIQSWRRLNLQVILWPKAYFAVPLSTAIYLNFFTHHFIGDYRWVLTVLLFIVFYRTVVVYEVGREQYRMPMILSFFLIAFFIWIAENISTLLGGYMYPDQAGSWHLVHLGKISSWFLLVVISMIIVAQLKRVKAGMGG